MAKSNIQRVQDALNLLKNALFPFVKREMKAHYNDAWLRRAAGHQPGHAVDEMKTNGDGWDVQVLFHIMTKEWRHVFSKTLGHAERSLVSEIWEVRKQWAHQRSFSTDDTYRALDSIDRLLKSISAEESSEVEKAKQDLLRIRYKEQARRDVKKATEVAVEGQPQGGLKSWREVIMPHPDVATGRYQQAEFAADLWEVAQGNGSVEYTDPVEFFHRTYITDGLRKLLVGGLQRMSETGGDPVVQLQTNFGGGKTHSMLALYHLLGDASVRELPGLESVLEEAGVSELPDVKRVVLVGNKISPGQPREKEDGTLVNTLWGELAWQLGGREAYEMIRGDDERATNPGDGIKKLLEEYGPALILIDEWVAYARQLHEQNDLPGGSFDTHFTFAQTLSEDVKNAPGNFLVVSIPASDNELGGQKGKEAVDRLKNAIGRIDSPWKPATAEEGFEIVRRRLFQSIEDPELHRARNAVCQAFSRMYQQQQAEFPAACREREYERRMRTAYPIHPELFDRLYKDWSTIDRFQRTRGVLRLMASVIHYLWERQDKNLLIMPSTVPIDAVQGELTTRYLEDNWVPIIEQDVDGRNSLPLKLDNDNPNLGKYSAARRVARTIYLGSAPKTNASNRGIDEKRVQLGCVQPGERVAIFGDALRRLSDKATYLYVDGSTYWYDTQPTVTKLAVERAAQQTEDEIHIEIENRLNDAARKKGDFVRVHVAPRSGADVSDEEDARLVVLGPAHPHIAKVDDSPALTHAKEILSSRGTGDRRFKNTLIFLAADKTRLDELTEAVTKFLAWESIIEDRETLNMTPFQDRQAKTKLDDADGTVKQRLRETYQWTLVPEQNADETAPRWNAKRINGGSKPLAERVSERMVKDELLVTTMAGTILRYHLDRIPLWQGDHINIEQLHEYLTKYLYLPRIKDSSVLIDAIQDGITRLSWSTDTFAYADRWDDEKERYIGLTAGKSVSIQINKNTVLVKPEVALQQFEAEQKEKQSLAEESSVVVNDGGGLGEKSGEFTGGEVEIPRPKRYFGTISLDPLQAETKFGDIVQNVIRHLQEVVDADVKINIDIEANFPEGVDESTERAVSENSSTLGFEQHEFEND